MRNLPGHCSPGALALGSSQPLCRLIQLVHHLVVAFHQLAYLVLFVIVQMRVAPAYLQVHEFVKEYGQRPGNRAGQSKSQHYGDKHYQQVVRQHACHEIVQFGANTVGTDIRGHGYVTDGHVTAVLQLHVGAQIIHVADAFLIDGVHFLREKRLGQHVRGNQSVVKDGWRRTTDQITAQVIDIDVGLVGVAQVTQVDIHGDVRQRQAIVVDVLNILLDIVRFLQEFGSLTLAVRALREPDRHQEHIHITDQQHHYQRVGEAARQRQITPSVAANQAYCAPST